MPCGGHLRYRQIFPRAYWFVHLHHLVFILQKHKEKLHVLDDSLTADAYPYPAGASFWNPATNKVWQQPSQPQKQQKRGGSLQQIQCCHFIFRYAFRRSSTCESCTLKTPSNLKTAPYRIVKVPMVGTRRIELLTARLSVVCSTN